SCGLSHGERRAMLAARHGLPAPADPGDALRLIGARAQVHPRDVVAFVYRDDAAADAYAASNADHYGLPLLGRAAPAAGGGVVGVLDLRPELTRRGLPETPPDLPDGWPPGVPP